MAEEVDKIEEKDFRIEITKNTKGYNWSVKVISNDIEDLKVKLENLENWCRTRYGNVE